MPGTFSQIYIQVVFAVKGRENLINDTWKTECIIYCGHHQRKRPKVNHYKWNARSHNAFIGLRPAMPVSDLVRDIKNNSTNFINNRKLVKKKFSWQEGYGAFSYSHSQISSVYNYILHRKGIIKRKHSGKSSRILKEI